MKELIICALSVVSISLGSFAQSIKVNETDPSTGKKKIETDYATLVNKYPTYLYAKYKVADTAYTLELRGGDIAVAIIETNDKLVIKLADSSEVQGYSVSKQNFTVDDNAKYYTHDYRLSRSSIETLSKQKVAWIRKYASGTFTDIPVPENYRESLKNLSIILLTAVGK